MDKFKLRNKLISILKADTGMIYLIDSMMLTGTGIKYESEVYLDINNNMYYLYTTKSGNKLDKVFKTKDTEEIIKLMIYFIVKAYKQRNVAMYYTGDSYDEYCEIYDKYQKGILDSFYNKLDKHYTKYINSSEEEISLKFLPIEERKRKIKALYAQIKILHTLKEKEINMSKKKKNKLDNMFGSESLGGFSNNGFCGGFGEGGFGSDRPFGGQTFSFTDSITDARKRYNETIDKVDAGTAEDMMLADIQLGSMIYRNNNFERTFEMSKVKESICNIVDRYETRENALLTVIGALSTALVIVGIAKRKK